MILPLPPGSLGSMASAAVTLIVLYTATVATGAGAVADIKLLLRGRVSGVERIARRAWRIAVALFMATGSLLVAQQKLLPVLLRGSPWMFIPTFLPVAIMMFWLVRFRLAKLVRDFGNGRIRLHNKLETA